MKSTLSWTLTLLGVAMIVLAVYQFNQFMVHQATVMPTLDQLEKLGAVTDGQRELAEASANALIQSVVLDLILGLLFLAGGFWLAPKETAHHHAIDNHSH